MEGRPVEQGDFTIIDFKGERMTGGPLEGAEAEDYMLEVGGELQLRGLSPRGDSWRIAVERP